ncbi:MAG: nucleotidyltransferase family protein [Vicinamibacterales bacterium]
MKAVILARGAGTRMRQSDAGVDLTPAQRLAASTGQKAMMPIGASAPRPFLDYVISAVADAGCRDVCLVVAPDHDAIRRHYTVDARPRRVTITFAVQDEPLGTAHAVRAAEAFANAEPFLVLNADNLYPTDVLRALVHLDGPGLPGFERDALVAESGFPASRVAAFALLDVDDAGRLRRIVEKPGDAQMAAAGPRALISMNVWRFDHRIFEACRRVPRSARGEFELPEAVGWAVRAGTPFVVVPARGAVLDLSRRGDVAAVARRLADLEPCP